MLFKVSQHLWHFVCPCLQRGQVLTWQLSWQHGRQTKVNMDCCHLFSAHSGTAVQRAKLAPPPLPCPASESGHRWSAESMSLVTHSLLNTSHTANRPWCYVNSYHSVCSERRSRGDRYDSMVSAIHVSTCRRAAVCLWFLSWWTSSSHTRWSESLFLSVVRARRHGHCDAFSLCMHTDLGLLLPGNSCLLGYHRAAVVQRSTRRANQVEPKPTQFLSRLPSGLGCKPVVWVRSQSTCNQRITDWLTITSVTSDRRFVLVIVCIPSDQSAAITSNDKKWLDKSST